MTTDDRKRDLIEQVAAAIYSVAESGASWLDARMTDKAQHRTEARAALAVFEAAQKPSDDEREALIVRLLDLRADMRHNADEVATLDMAIEAIRRPVPSEPQTEPTDARWIDEIETKALAQQAAYARMLDIGEGVGGLGVRNPAMFKDMLAWDESSGNEHADTVLRLISALRAAREADPR